MNQSSKQSIRVLTAADLHQLLLHYRSLAHVVAQHRPDVVALVGDLLDLSLYSSPLVGTTEAAALLAELPVKHLIFVRGNHEDRNWSRFVEAWTHERRPLTALYGTACAIGPLVIVGFPCMTGDEFHWAWHFSAINNVMETNPRANRQPLPSDFETWLPALMRKTGPAGRTLWLLHEPPVGRPIADPRHFNPIWTIALERFAPRLTISGHDHSSPLQNGIWHTRLGNTTCINVGQSETEFHYALLDFEFAGAAPSLPRRITVKAFPWNEQFVVKPDDRTTKAK